MADSITKLSEDLVIRSAAVRRIKQALDVSPMLLGTGAGALIGGLAGGGSASMRKGKRKGVLRNALQGAVLGAGTGAGIGSLVSAFGGKGSGGSGGGAAGLPGSIASKAPDIAKQLDGAKPSFMDRTMATAAAPFKAVGDYTYNHPILAGIAGADATSHAVGTAANSARNLAGVSSANPDDLTIGLDRMLADNKDGDRSMVEKWKALKARIGGNKETAREYLLKSRQSNLNSRGNVLDQQMDEDEGALGKMFGGKPKAKSIANNITDVKPIPGTGAADTDGLTAQELFNVTRKGQDAVQPGGWRDLVDLGQLWKSRKNQGSGVDAHRARFTAGTPEDFGRAVSDTGNVVSNLPDGNPSTVLERLRAPSTRRMASDWITGAPRGSTLLRSLLPRLAIYGGVPLAQSGAQNWLKDLAEKRKLQQILKNQQG